MKNSKFLGSILCWYQGFQNKPAAAGAPAGVTRFTAGYFVLTCFDLLIHETTFYWSIMCCMAKLYAFEIRQISLRSRFVFNSSQPGPWLEC